MSHDHLNLESRCIHGGQHVEPTTGAVMPPIFTSSTFIQESPGVHKGFEYSRSHNATRFAFERCVANLESSGLREDDERTCGGFAFASGLAAIGTALELLDHGAPLVCMDDVYGGTNRLLNRVRKRSQGLKVEFVDMTDLARLEAAAKAHRPRMIWVETPTNPTLKLVDLAALLVRRTLNPQGLNIGVNEGRAAGAGLPEHLHVHLVPRWSGDVNFMAAIGGLRMIPDSLDAVHEAYARTLATLA